MQPLYQAIPHGCLAGLQQWTFDDVYLARILRSASPGGFYSTRNLGAIGADLGAVACFFDTPWTTVSPSLTPAYQAWLLNQAAICLRALGRLTEAAEPMRAGLEMRIGQNVWKSAAIIASNLSELELTRGEVSAAVATGQQSVTYADHTEDTFQRMSKRTTHADALHQAGQADDAQRLFEEAESLQAENEPTYPKLYSVQGFQYCDLLLSPAERVAWRSLTAWPTARASTDHLSTVALPSDNEHRTAATATCTAVIERADWSLKIAERNHWLLEIALDHLTLARATLYQTIISRSEDPKQQSHLTNHLAAAVDGLRASGQMDDLPRGLLTRAWFRYLTNDERGSREDLDEAWEIAERGLMPLFQADILLTRARLFGRRKDEGASTKEAPDYPWGSVQADLAAARRLIDTHGYHRRDAELADAEQALLA